jgi:hypothetical protein
LQDKTLLLGMFGVSAFGSRDVANTAVGGTFKRAESLGMPLVWTGMFVRVARDLTKKSFDWTSSSNRLCFKVKVLYTDPNRKTKVQIRLTNAQIMILEKLEIS